MHICETVQCPKCHQPRGRPCILLRNTSSGRKGDTTDTYHAERLAIAKHCSAHRENTRKENGRR